MEESDSKILIEKERTKRIRILEKALGRIAIIFAAVLLIMTMLITFAVNVF